MTKQAIVIGSGPNGLAAAVRMAQAGRRVTVYEAQDAYGGGCRSMEMTLPGYLHDHCSAIHPLGIGSPYFRTLPLAAHGLEWIHPDAPLAHPLDDGAAAVLEKSLAATSATLGEDGNAYARLFGPLIPDWDKLCDALRRPLRCALHPIGAAKFGLPSLMSAELLVDMHFRSPHARALMAGIAAHSFLPLDETPSGAFAMALGIMGHAVGWPMPRGGSQKIMDALVDVLRDLDGEVVTGKRIASLDEMPEGVEVFADVDARNLLKIAGDRLPGSYRAQLKRFKPGPSIFKLDYALDGPIPWKAKACLRAGTVHLGGTFEEIALSERLNAEGRLPERPYVLLAQQSLFDPTRAPEGGQTVWAYCHAPTGFTGDATAQIEAQIERFAPGFTNRVLARTATSGAAFEAYNENLIGGDISGGAYTLAQMIFRPALQPNPWATGVKNFWLCSSSTPPGGGVHGLCGYYAAQSALGELWRL